MPFVATRHSPARPTPPLASPCSCGAAQRLSLDRKPPEPKTPFTPVVPSVAELAAGDSSHHRRPSDHREDRPGLAGPSLPSGALEEPPFVDGDRRSPAPVRAEKRRERGEWSNLTSGPSGPTVSDPRANRAGLSGSVFPRVRIPYPESVFCIEAFSFFWFYLKQNFDWLYLLK